MEDLVILRDVTTYICPAPEECTREQQELLNFIRSWVAGGVWLVVVGTVDCKEVETVVLASRVVGGGVIVRQPARSVMASGRTRTGFGPPECVAIADVRRVATSLDADKVRLVFDRCLVSNGTVIEEAMRD